MLVLHVKWTHFSYFLPCLKISGLLIFIFNVWFVCLHGALQWQRKKNMKMRDDVLTMLTFKQYFSSEIPSLSCRKQARWCVKLSKFVFLFEFSCLRPVNLQKVVEVFAVFFEDHFWRGAPVGDSLKSADRERWKKRWMWKVCVFVSPRRIFIMMNLCRYKFQTSRLSAFSSFRLKNAVCVMPFILHCECEVVQ